MHFPCKVMRYSYLSLMLGLLTLPRLIYSLPTVPSSLQRNLIQNLDKSFFQRPALEETIHEVQRILNQDPSLPRLTRGEIEELYEKVTKEEYEKSMKAGDKLRADSMRALMLVLPFNTDNNTEENLQELFTRPPVTKVVDSYSSHQPIQFLTPSFMNNEGKFDTKIVGKMDATTYKPSFSIKTKTIPLNPTTYHPSNPPALLNHATSYTNEAKLAPFKPITSDLLENFEYKPKPVQRFSSHYNAKNAEFLKMGLEQQKKPPQLTISTVKPVADILHSLGIVPGNIQTRSRLGMEDYYAAESAPNPSIVSVADLKGVGPKIKPDAYSMFKPLNIGEEIRVKPEIEGYLTRFGIVGGRKRKAIKKNESSSTQNSLEPLSQESEIATAKVPSNHVKAKKGAPALGNTELEKLLENLKELERLNVNPSAVGTTARPAAVYTTKSTTTTTTTTAQAPTTTAISLITNGEPILVQAKKPRRRVDPNIEAKLGNLKTEPNKTDELSKLLENLQELEKLKINPEKVLKVGNGINSAASKNVAIEAAAPKQPATLINRFTKSEALTPQQQLLLFQQQAQVGSTATPDLDELQKVLQQLQVYEKNNAKALKAATTTTKRTVTQQTQIGPTDLWQLRKLLTDDNELEKLFEQAKARQQQTEKIKSTKATTSTTSTTSTTTTTTSTTKKPKTSSVTDLIQLQRYLAELEKANSRATTTTSTTSTTTTTPRPLLIPQYVANDFEDRPKKLSMENREIQALINRVQQLERLNSQHKELEKPIPTDIPLTSLLGFTTRNVKLNSQKQDDYRLPVNDFANLRTLYKQVEDAERLSQGEVEISTKATAVKAYQEQQLETGTRKTQNFVQRIIDITNDTGSGSSLQEVDPNDFIHLQKLLSKVQELERVRIHLPTAKPARSLATTKAPNLDVAASQRTQNVHYINEAHIVYPSRINNYKQVEDLFLQEGHNDDLNLDLPVFKKSIEKPKIGEKVAKDLTSSEELKDLVYAQTLSEETAYKNLQPPMIQKTVTKEPPRFVATKSPKEIKQTAKTNGDLEEIQKLLNNAQELKKLGVSLPNELTQQLETQFSKKENDATHQRKMAKNDAKETQQYANEVAGKAKTLQPTQTDKNVMFAPTTASSEDEELSEKTAVFSLTTMKSLTPRPPKTNTESSVELPVFSATKIIEAAIKRAANRIGVSTESSNGFRRRQDTYVDESKDDMVLGVDSDSDLIADFSEINYQLAAPDDKPTMQSQEKDIQADLRNINYEETKELQPKPAPDLTANVDELQRLIKNLQELKNLNLSPNDKALLRQADLKYLENMKKQQTAGDETTKTRRQSDKSNEKTTLSIDTSNPANTESTRIQLNLSLDDSDIANANDSDIANTTSATTATAAKTTTEEPRNGSLTDLEDSFGPNPITESPAPAKKKNGFYFLADWNSFLEVGDGDDQVVVRLSPKIGDPRLFLPVKIP